MPNIVATELGLGVVMLNGGKYRDEILTVAGAGTIAAGTILARDSISLKLVPFVKGGSTNENGIPKAVLVYDVEAEGAGDISIRAAVEGHYKKQRLIIAADGDDSNIDAAVVDQLRNYGLLALDIQELSVVDTGA